MQDNPTLRDVAQAFSAWLSAQSQTVKAWLSRLGDIPVNTVFAVIMIGLALIFCALLFAATPTDREAWAQELEEQRRVRS
jgi:hypothetical protein